MSEFSESLLELFDLFPLGVWLSNGAEALVQWLTINAKPFLSQLILPIDWIMNGLDDFLNWLPWPLVVLLFLAIGWKNGGRQVGLLAAAGLILTGFLGYWELTMTTLAMVLTALLISVLLGVPLGIWASRSDTVNTSSRFILDGMQSRVGYGRVTVVTSTFPLAPLRTGLEPFSSSGSPANLGQFGVNLASMNVSVAWSAHDKGFSVDGNHSFYPLRWFLCSTLPLLFQVF